MVLSSNYEIVEIADELLAVPVGKMANICKDVFTFNDAAAALVKQLKTQSTQRELIDLLVGQYEIDDQTAAEDVNKFVSTLLSYGLIDQ